jgi:hypothetical protein
MSEDVRRPGLWPVPGDGVLARQGDLVLLASIGDHAVIDALTSLLTEVAEVGGGGLQLVSAVEDALAARASGPDGSTQPGPAVVAFGPAGAGLAVTVCGVAWAEISTAHGTQRLGPVQPGLQLRCALRGAATMVRAGLGAGPAADLQTDRFAHLDGGVIRAAGLQYIPPAAVGAPASAADRPASMAEPAASRQGPQPARTEPPATPAEPPAAPAEAPAAPAEPAAPPAASDAAARFESVLLVGESQGQADERPPLPQQPPDGAGQAVPMPTILGVYCKNGHFDDPEARFCAVCGISMNQQTLARKPGPRPPLGVLAFDDGSIFQLDTNYVIGRDPALSPEVAAGHARPLCVTDDAGIVSRAHAALQLDGWRVLVKDLGSANGTRIRPHGAESDEQLAPHVPAELTPGSHVDLGGCGFRYESHRGR